MFSRKFVDWTEAAVSQLFDKFELRKPMQSGVQREGAFREANYCPTQLELASSSAGGCVMALSA